MALVAAVAGLVVIEYLVIVFLTGRSRGTTGVPAPSVVGHPDFERWYRVQLNTVEQLVAFFPGLALFAVYVNTSWAAGLGLVFFVGRALYARGYVQDPAKRGPGFGITLLANVTLVVGGFLGALAAWL